MDASWPFVAEMSHEIGNDRNLVLETGPGEFRHAVIARTEGLYHSGIGHEMQIALT
jgi:hypothetical protein